jgi:Ser/Thr protein kinase RdoA (MazF antagonist)
VSGHSKSAETVPEGLRLLAAERLGELLGAENLSWQHGESAVWRVAGRRGRLIVKHHRQLRKWRQEVRAYLEWLPALDGATSELLAVREQPPRGILLSLLPGAPLAGLTLPPEREMRLHAQAGAFLRRLHDLPVADDDPLPLAEAFEQRLHAWTVRARGLVSPPSLDAVGGRVREALPMLGGARRVACHRDFTPRNWLVDPQRPGRLAVIDFEHARPDLWLMDLERLWSGTWRDRPDLEQAFLEGYGRQLAEDDSELLERLAALAAMTTVVWAREHGDREFEVAGRATLERLGLAG